MIRLVAVAVALLTLLSVDRTIAPAAAQSLDEIRRQEAAVYDAWQKTPLTVSRAVFVAQHPDGFGQFVERPSNTFKVGEKLVAYIEPVGYGWKKIAEDQFQFGFDVDFLIKSPDDKILGGQENFAKLEETSHARNREFMVTLTLDVSGAPPGDYKVEYKLRDIASDKNTTVTLPFTLVK